TRSSAVSWLGEVDDVTPFIADADVVVLPSYREGLPRSLLEGAAMGRALIATDVPGCRAVVKNGVNGMLVRPRDSRSLADAMRQLIENPEIIARMGANGRAYIAETFDERIVIETTLRAYADV